MDKPVIIFDKVSKDFYIQEEKTFKEFLPNLFLGKPWAKKVAALDDVTFNIFQGETVGIIGKNGAGKSTALKLIAGVTTPTRGKVIITGKVAPLIELGAGFHHELTGYENIFLNAAILGLHKKEIEIKLNDIIEFSELKDFIYAPVKKYSSGMYMRLAFSIAINTNAPLLLIDEVLAVGDEDFQRKCLNYLQEIKKSREKTIIFVSHSEQSVKKFCERVILLDHGKLITEGDPTEVFEKYHHILEETNRNADVS
ncbi:MAG: ABC transporter ATP-binding protein [Candidatus Daviesbacteria bacterium]|nr:ABC transporter ATP-binding protein [Candidatus Daviesbacteria bacterium]